MRLPSYKNVSALWCSLACLTGFAVMACAEGQTVGQQRYSQAPAYNNQSLASLRVTGNAMRLSIFANRADVRDTLKAIFDQTGKQFVLSNNVTGQVTLRLENQSLNRVLNDICEQTFNAYIIELTTGVYRFARNEQALQKAIQRLRFQDGAVRDQLRLMGLGLPDEAAFANFYRQNQGANFSGGGGGFGGGGFGGGGIGAGGPGGNSGVPQNLSITQDGPPNNTRVPGGANRQVLRSQTNKKTDAANNLQRGRNEPAPNAPGGRENKTGLEKGDKTEIGEGGPVGPDTANAQQPQLLDAYPVFLKENGLYGVNTQGQQIPVTDLLLELGRASNVPVIIDPSVPAGKKFRINGILPPRRLEETLNYIAPPARLEWRWVGNSILVTTTPEFELFWGESEIPRVSVPNAKEQRGKNIPEESQKRGLEQKSNEATDKTNQQGKAPDKSNPKKKE